MEYGIVYLLTNPYMPGLECTGEPHSMVNSKHIMRFNYIFNI